LIIRQDRPSYQPSKTEEMIVSGPIINIARPWVKTARSTSVQKDQYDPVDLTEITDSFLPRTVYKPGTSIDFESDFVRAIPTWPRPTLPGFWPIKKDELGAWEQLCGEPLVLHGEVAANCEQRPTQQYAFFSQVGEHALDEISCILRGQGGGGEQPFVHGRGRTPEDQSEDSDPAVACRHQRRGSVASPMSDCVPLSCCCGGRSIATAGKSRPPCSSGRVNSSQY
jgi:hypothetical protein